MAQFTLTKRFLFLGVKETDAGRALFYLFGELTREPRMGATSPRVQCGARCHPLNFLVRSGAT